LVLEYIDEAHVVSEDGDRQYDEQLVDDVCRANPYDVPVGRDQLASKVQGACGE